jgi:NAD(P)-dependent dehydrogenase (short-subunit alcohol dehydrogenase family)
MYTICAIAPVFLIQHLYKSGSIIAAGDDRGKVIIVTSEAGSVALRTEKEGGGMYGHHGSKAAANMIGRLLSFDLKPSGISVAMIHVGGWDAVSREI